MGKERRREETFLRLGSGGGDEGAYRDSLEILMRPLYVGLGRHIFFL